MSIKRNENSFTNNLLLIICLILFGLSACRSEVEKINVNYPNHNYFIGQSLSDFKEECNCILREADNDGGRKGQRYFAMEDSIDNTHIRTYIFLSFKKEILVSFNCQFKSTDSSENIKLWIDSFYADLISKKANDRYVDQGNSIIKELIGNSFSCLAINGNSSNFSNSVYLVGDYRYKEIDW